jgi:hypothetical protein
MKKVEILELSDDLINGKINRARFEKWVDYNGLRDWVSNVCENGQHREYTGRYSWEYYYDGGGAEYDLYWYLRKKYPLLTR